MNIPFSDLKAQYQAYKKEIDLAIHEVIEHTSFIQGKAVEKLEKNLAAFIGSSNCISCSSGTDALLLALMAIDLKPGDEVITTPFSFFATAEVIMLLGGKPVFADIEEDTYNISVKLIENKITPKTKAIIPVSLYGQCPDMDEINQIAKARRITVIEDAAQSFGATYKGHKSCNLSSIGCTSFFPSKPLGCYGDGGAVFTNDPVIGKKLRMIMNHGQSQRYHHQIIGLNARLDAIQAAVLNVKLKYLDQELERRKFLGQRYTDLLKQKSVITPTVKSDRDSVYAQYTIRTTNRDDLIKRLNDNGVPTSVHYPVPLYRQEAIQHIPVDPLEFSVTEKISREVLSLPMSAFLTEEQQAYIVTRIR
jgi:UDP-2-acetamido-2-deoxy-ribo-hexuluronate aminotransferase